MEYGKTALISKLSNVPREGWTVQKVKDMVDSLWRNPVMLRWSGFEHAGGTDCNISFNEATRVFTIAPKINIFTYYHYRTKLSFHAMEEAYEAEIPDTQGLHVIYFDADPDTKKQALLTTMPDSEEIERIYLNAVIVAWIYWIPEDPITEEPGRAIYFGDSRHGSEWPSQVHWWNHQTANSERASGLTITDTQSDRDGSENSHAQLSITPGAVMHSDIRKELDGSSPASLPIWFMLSGAPNVVGNTGYCFYVDGLICYNNGSAPTPAQDGKYVMYHLFATNCLLQPLISAMGLAQYSTLGDALMNAQYEIDVIRHTFPHSNMMLIDTVVFQAGTVYGNTVKTRLVAMAGGNDEKVATADKSTGILTGVPGYLDDDAFDSIIVNGKTIYTPKPSAAVEIPTINQVAHGFVVGDVIRHNGTIYVKAQADNDVNAQACGIVSDYIDVDNFKFIADGVIAGLGTPGAEYFLSPTSAGQLITLPTPEVWNIGEVRLSCGWGTPLGMKVEIDVGDVIGEMVFEQLQSDWQENNSGSPAYIRNKPAIPEPGVTSVETEMSITGDGTPVDKVKLVGDQQSPSEYRYYGTNYMSQKGYHALPREAVQLLSGATPVFNLDLGRGAVILLTANTVITFSNLEHNDTGHIEVVQGGIGGYTLSFAGATVHIAFNSYEAPGRVKLTGMVGSKDIVAYWYTGDVMNLAVIFNVLP